MTLLSLELATGLRAADAERWKECIASAAVNADSRAWARACLAALVRFGRQHSLSTLTGNERGNEVKSIFSVAAVQLGGKLMLGQQGPEAVSALASAADILLSVGEYELAARQLVEAAGHVPRAPDMAARTHLALSWVWLREKGGPSAPEVPAALSGTSVGICEGYMGRAPWEQVISAIDDASVELWIRRRAANLGPVATSAVGGLLRRVMRNMTSADRLCASIVPRTERAGILSLLFTRLFAASRSNGELQ